MHKRHLQLKAGLVGRDTTVFEEVPGLAYLERPIRFSLRDCNTRNFCIRCLTNDEIRLLYKRLGYFEQVSWKMVRGMPREAGFSIEKKGDIAAILTNLTPKDVLFIDEIHRMNIAIEEILYSAMEDFRLDIVIGQGPSARTMQIDVPPFTLIGATTRTGLLSNPLRDRFMAHLHFDFYESSDIGRRRFWISSCA